MELQTDKHTQHKFETLQGFAWFDELVWTNLVKNESEGWLSPFFHINTLTTEQTVDTKQ